MERYEIIRNSCIKDYNSGIEKLKKYKEELEKVKLTGNTVFIEIYETRINNLISVRLKDDETRIEFIRENNELDLEERNQIRKTFSNKVKQIIPDGTPIVFHGNRNIGMVREIIKTGGLFTPDQRGINQQSCATKVDVTYKNNIQTSCEFAEPGIDSFMPYGAIFVFTPLESEYEKVINTGENSEVAGGIDGVNFREKPERLIAIITTDESKDNISSWCNQYGWDASKVYNHYEFIEMCKNKYSNIEKDSYKAK